MNLYWIATYTHSRRFYIDASDFDPIHYKEAFVLPTGSSDDDALKAAVRDAMLERAHSECWRSSPDSLIAGATDCTIDVHPTDARDVSDLQKGFVRREVRFYELTRVPK